MGEEKKDFFRFYRENNNGEKGDGFEETQAAYKNIIIALAKAGKLKKVETEETEITYENGEKEIVQKPVLGKNGKLKYEEGIDFAVYYDDGKLNEEETFKNVIKKCKEIDDAAEKSGKIKEDKIGLRGFFTSLGYTEEGFGKDELKAAFKEMGDDALKQLPNLEGELDKFAKAREEILNNPNLSDDEKDEKIADLEDGIRPLIESYAFLGELAAGPYFPRTTCFSASHFMSIGRIMQIGCSQGKTSVVAMTTYIQMKMGKQVFSTSSAPGLVPENYDEARAFYKKMGIEEEFCAISQNKETKKDHIVLFHTMPGSEESLKYEICEDGQIYVETVDGKEKKMLPPKEPFTKEELESLGLVLNGEKGYDFKASVKEMMAKKKIIMGDTITLGKYQDLMPERDVVNGVIKNSFLIVDEADAELLDTFAQEILGDVYEGKIATDRWNLRKEARKAIEAYTGEPSGLEAYAKEKELPLDFIADAYEAKNFEGKDKNGNPTKYQIKYEENENGEKVGKVFILNPHTNVMIPASQGLAQAILANNFDYEQSPVAEMEVLGETNIPELFSNFEIASLMSGTMEDKGMSKYLNPELREIYEKARKEFLGRCGEGVKSSAENGVIDWRLITPQTREEKGDVVVSVDENGIDRDENRKPPIQTIKQEINVEEYKPTTDKGKELNGWRAYLADNGEKLEDNWRKAVAEEAKVRSDAGQPVMISVYGERNPMPEVPLYTDTNQIGSKENGTDDHKMDDDTCMFVNEGKGEIACFDDFYGRGYTFKFIEREKKEDGKLGVKTKKNKEGKDKPVKADKGGHVLITALPENSRNLEQFLFRVARGGAKGSSSVVISPNDPTLVKYLEELEQKEPPEGGPEKANEYFQGVINGTIPIMKMVADIYPEATMKIFKDKAEEVDAIILYQAQLDMGLEQIDTIGKIGGRDNTSLSENYKKRFNKEMLKRNKLNRQAGVDVEHLEEQAEGMMFAAIDEMIKNREIENVADFASIIPGRLSDKYLETIIPDENKREEVKKTIEKIQRYADRKNVLEREVEVQIENEQKTGGDSEQKRDTINQTVEATLESEGYNLTEVKNVLEGLRAIKLPSKEQNREENGVEK